MNILLIAPPTLPIPPFEGYGGTQRGIYDFLKYFPSFGHKIHLIAPGDSNLFGLENIIGHFPIEKSTESISSSYDEVEKNKLIENYYKGAKEIAKNIISNNDISIVNSRVLRLDLLQDIAGFNPEIPVVVSLHIFNDDKKRVDELKSLNGNYYYTTHCINHMAQYKTLKNVSVIMYGIDVTAYPFSNIILSENMSSPNLDLLNKIKKTGRDYFTLISRISKIKGQKTAIELVLNETNEDIIIAGTPSNRGSNNEGREYLEKIIMPYVKTGRVHYFGNANEEEKKELLKYSCGFIFPSGFEFEKWKEPFGRAPVEALACGVPVLAYNQGSLSEIIEQGKNGFLFENINEAKVLIKRLHEIDRYECRMSAEQKFDGKRVARDYNTFFKKIVGVNVKK